MKRTLLRLFAMSVALALQFGAAAQTGTIFQATVPSGHRLKFKVMSPTTCRLTNNSSIVGERVTIPPTVSDGTNTYTVTSMHFSALSGVTMGGNTKQVDLPNTLDSMYSTSLEQLRVLEQLVIPASVSWIGGQAIYACNTLKRIAFLGDTPPATSAGGWNMVVGYRQVVEHIYVPAGKTAVYQTAFGAAFPNATIHEWGTATPTVGSRTDTLFHGMPYCLNGRMITAAGTYTDSALYYTHDSLTTVTLTAVPYSFYADAPTGQRLYYRIARADSVEVVAPNDYGWTGYTKPTDSLAIPATVTHDGHNYSVFRIARTAFYLCDAITALTLPEGIAEVGEGAFDFCEAMTHISLPRSLRIVESSAFQCRTQSMSPRNLTLASDTIWAEVIYENAFNENIISQPLVLPNVRSIGFAAFNGISQCPYIWVGDSCTSIGDYAFQRAAGQTIGSISLGTSLQTVGNYALTQSATIRSVEFRGATVPSFGEGIFFRTQVDSIITPCGTSAAYRTALDAAPVNNRWDASATLFAERGCPVNVFYDTLFYAMGPVTFAGRSITSPGEYRDTIHLPGYDSINILVVSEAHYSFSVDTLGNRLWYRIIGTDRVAVVPPNTLYLSYSGYTEPSGNLDIPDTVRHGGTAYAVVQVGNYAFKQCYSLDGYISLPPTIDTIGYEAFDRCSAVKKLVIPASVNFFNENCFFKTMTLGQNDTLVFLGSDASRLSTWASMFGSGSRWDSKILVPCGSMAAYSAVRGIPAACLQEYGCTVVVHIYDTMCAGTTYHWANKAIISGGTFYDTVHRPLYDSVTILHLVSQGNWNMGGGLFPEVFCETSLPFTWHEQYIDAPGDYTHDERVLTSRGCWLRGKKYEMTVFQWPRTYIYDTVRSTAKGYDYSDTTVVSVQPVNYYGPCPDSLVTTITWHDLDETTDTVRTILYDTICAGTIYHFGGRYLLRSDTYYDTVRMPFRDSITVLHLEVEGTMANSLHTEVICETSLPYIWDGDTITTPGTHHLDHSVFNPRGCLMSGNQLQLTVVPRAKTYIYDTVVSTAKGYDYDDTTQVSVLRQGSRNSPCPDSLVTTYTHYDLDESVDTLRVFGSHQQCDGTYLFGGIERTATGTYTDTVVVDPFHVTITTLDLTVNYSNTGDTAAVACDVFTWHGVDYTASAAPQHVYTNAAGCDSTVTLALTVNYSNTGDTAAVACDAFTWHGTTYTASAAPQHVYTNAAGCDSTVTLALTVNYSNTGDTAAVVCDAFTWHGTTYTASAAPQHVYTNAAGCDSTVTLALTVNYSNTGDTAAVACDAFTWHGVDYTASAAPQHVYTNAAGCDSTVTLALTVNYSNTGDTAAVACDAFTWHGTTYTASAAPQHVYTNAAGCDSTVTLALTVNYSNTGDTAAVACDAFSWHGTTYTASAAPQHVYTNAAGCDSTVTLALTINYSNTGDTAAVACDAFTWHGTTYTASAAPQHVYTNAAGCDSTVMLALTVNYSSTGDTAAVACDAFTWHGTTYTASAAPQHVYTNAAGCDSTVTLALTVNYSNTGDTAAVACDAFTWHGTTYTASAAPQHVYTNAAGCDSTVTLALTINYSNTGTETADVCDEYTWQGTTYTVSNTTDQVVLTNVAGCDSTVTLNLTVRHSSTGDTVAVAFDIFTWYGHTYRATTTATHTLTNAEGCDSTVTLALTILESYSTDAAFGENGIEVEAYGYCAGPGAVRYRLSSGQPNEYRLAFAHAAFPAADWTPIATPGSIDIEVPAGLATGDYSATLQFRHSSWPELTSAAIPVVIHVNLPETYVQPLFNDVIALVDTCQCLTDVQWYHREAGETEWTLIPGANDYYYHQEGGLTGEYFVSAKMNGVETYTCPQSDMGTLITDGNITLTAYPNPTASVVTLTLDGSRRASHEVRVLTTTGIELERRSFEGDSLRMDLSAYPRGSYIVSVDGMAVRVIRN